VPGFFPVPRDSPKKPGPMARISYTCYIFIQNLLCLFFGEKYPNLIKVHLKYKESKYNNKNYIEILEPPSLAPLQYRIQPDFVDNMRGIFVQMPPNDKHYRTLESI
jgi:hypothetical protein